MISASEFLKWLQVFNVLTGSPSSYVTPEQVQRFAFNFNDVSGVDDAFVVTLDPPVTALTDGLIVTMQSGSLKNTLPNPTLQVNALAPVPIEVWASGLAAGDIQEGSCYLFIYNELSNVFQLINPSVTTPNTFLLQSNFYNTSADTGTADDYIVNLLPTPDNDDYPTGFTVFTQIANTNTGASTLTLNGVTAPITLNNGNPLPAGVLVANQVAIFVYNGIADVWVLLNPYFIPGTVQSLTGTTNQIDVNNTDPANPVASLSSTLVAPGTVAVGNILIDTNTISSTDTNGDLNLTPDGTGNLVLDGLNWPQADGSAGFFLSTDGAGNLNWSSGGGITWTEVTVTTETLAADNGYIANNAAGVTFTLPATAAVGTQISIIGKGAGGWTIEQNAGQNIQIGSVSTTVGATGSVESNNAFDSLTLICTTTDTTWTVLGGPQGNLTTQ